MTVLSASGLTLSFGDAVIFRDVSFSVNEGDRLGIIGSNGAGKTSLLRVLTGEYEADSGSVFIARDCTVGYLSQNTALTARTDRTTLFSYLLEAFDDVLAIEESILSLEAELAATVARQKEVE